MSAQHAVHPDLEALAELLADRMAGPLTIATVELARVMELATNVRQVPSGRWAGDYLPTCPQSKPWQVVGLQVDRARVTFVSLTTATEIYLGPKQDSARAGTGSLLLPVGVPISLATANAVWAYTEDATASLTWWIEEYDV